MRLRAVFFDIGDTLWHEAYPEMGSARARLGRAGAIAWAQEHGLTVDDPDRVANAVWNALTTARRVARAGDLREPDAGAIAHRAAAELGLALTASQATSLLDAIYVSGPASGKALYDDVVPVIEELRRRGFLLGMITNRAFGGPRFRADLRALGLELEWDVEVVSAECGYMKPHPAIFRQALAAAGAGAAQALMVGDSLADDIAGARDVGMVTAWRRSEPDAIGIEPDITFDSLVELLAYPELREAAA